MLTYGTPCIMGFLMLTEVKKRWNLMGCFSVYVRDLMMVIWRQEGLFVCRKSDFEKEKNGVEKAILG